MRATEVFTPGNIPEITYIENHLKERATHLRDALETGAAVVSLSGPSKSGKTVFIEKNIGRGNLVPITGAGVTSSDTLWRRVFTFIGTPIKTTTSQSAGFDVALTGKVRGGVPLIGHGEVGTTGAWSNSTGSESEISTDSLQLLIEELANSDLVVFIDDFHYIPRAVQVEISNQIKEAIRNGVKFVVASVPFHSDDAVRANPDLRGRTIKLDFDYWKGPELSEIAKRGFAALNISADPQLIYKLTQEAAGSPQLMQSLCLNLCFDSDIRETAETLTQIDGSSAAFQRVCMRTALAADYSSTVDKLDEGPKTRGQRRIAYYLKDGSVRDVYPLIVRALALDPPELTIRYANLQRRLASLCANESPSGSSVTEACFQMAKIANAAENRAILEWDKENDVLDIRDPYLLFYIRWGR